MALSQLPAQPMMDDPGMFWHTIAPPAFTLDSCSPGKTNEIQRNSTCCWPPLFPFACLFSPPRPCFSFVQGHVWLLILFQMLFFAQALAYSVRAVSTDTPGPALGKTPLTLMLQTLHQPKNTASIWYYPAGQAVHISCQPDSHSCIPLHDPQNLIRVRINHQVERSPAL